MSTTTKSKPTLQLKRRGSDSNEPELDNTATSPTEPAQITEAMNRVVHEVKHDLVAAYHQFIRKYPDYQLKELHQLVRDYVIQEQLPVIEANQPTTDIVYKRLKGTFLIMIHFLNKQDRLFFDIIRLDGLWTSQMTLAYMKFLNRNEQFSKQALEKELIQTVARWYTKTNERMTLPDFLESMRDMFIRSFNEDRVSFFQTLGKNTQEGSLAKIPVRVGHYMDGI